MTASDESIAAKVRSLRSEGVLALRGHGPEQWQWESAGDLARWLQEDDAKEEVELLRAVVRKITQEATLSTNTTIGSFKPPEFQAFLRALGFG